jgi:hypothetical protein
VDDAVRRELEALLRYARAVAGASARQPERTDIVDGGHGYVGGALTTLHHLDLLSDDEHKEWWDRLTGELPPPPGGWIGG